MSFGGFSAGPHQQNYPASAGGILNCGRLAAIFAGFEFQWTSLSAAFCMRKARLRLMPIWPPYVRSLLEGGTLTAV